MAATVKKRLIKEYLRKCGYIETYLTICGFSRCQISKERLRRKSLFLQMYSFIFMSTSTLCVTYIFHYAKNHEGFFLLSDTLMAYVLIIFCDVTTLEANFPNNGRMVELHNHYYEIDEYLDVDDTAFLRELEYKHCYAFISVCFVFAVFFTSALIFKFQSAPYTVLFCSIFIVMSLAGVGCDYVNYTRLHLFLVLRLRYLNVAMMKYSRTELEYVNGSFVFKALLWNSKCDDRVAFQRKAKPEDFSRMFRKIIDSYECFKTCYSFQIFASILQVIFGSITTVQLILDIFATENVFSIRLAALPLWNLFIWITLSVMFLFTDIFVDQLEDSKRICCYILLKDNTGPALMMAESVVRSLNIRQSQFMLYGMIKIDSSLSLRALAAILVIIMALLQFTFPTDKI